MDMIPLRFMKLRLCHFLTLIRNMDTDDVRAKQRKSSQKLNY
jgi:hypothetical protein